MAGATQPAAIRRRAAESDLSVGRVLLVTAGALFWGWLVASWLNRWLGGVVVPVGEPFVRPATVETALATLPGLAAYAEPIGFAVGISPEIARGAWLTIVITTVSLFIGFFIAVPLAVTRVYGRYSAYLSLGYTELLRGTPLLAQLFVLHFGLNLGAYVPGALSGVFPRNVVWVAILGFTLNGAAYQAEYIRGALESVEEGQITAGRAIGLSRVETIYYVVLPQGLRYAIPSWTNEFIYLIKYSSLAAFITVPELYYRADQIAASTFRYTLIFAVTGLAYLALVLTASKLMEAVEARVAIPGLGADRGR
ncbi:polar amino acid transport system permease protein [Halorubrum alkaliphilum]|uniref:Polar amino acid transport system permease protein n=1 Tax=Halorubrum alkaliphilum TaxID=261290 RepID=A0A8T4GDD7_9EURY|nr:amino acid ABC transporter permease [Halorubrum alkaliphilum]MBP1921135.1 polar amino acid transport system permease protein [Halorubrum alkaliphilum]